MRTRENNNNKMSEVSSNLDKKTQLENLTYHLHFLLTKKQSKINFINQMLADKQKVSSTCHDIVDNLTNEINDTITTISELKSFLNHSANTNSLNNWFKTTFKFLSSTTQGYRPISTSDTEITAASQKYEIEYNNLIQYLCGNEENKTLMTNTSFWNDSIRQNYVQFQQWLAEIKPLTEDNKKNISDDLINSEKHNDTFNNIPNACISKNNAKFLDNQYYLLVNLDRVAAGTVTIPQIEMLSKNQQYLTNKLCAKLNERYIGKFYATSTPIASYS